jgi:hypothetical protein
VSGQGRDPWADPNTPTEPGAPYAGPPATAPPTYGPPASPYGQYGYPGYPPPEYGYPPPWPVVPRPRRPGQVIASAVLAFVQGALVLIASLYVYFAASIVTVVTAGAPVGFDADGLATEGTVLAAVQVLSAVLLVAAGVLALNRRNPGTWLTLVVAHTVQIVLALYWWVRLVMLANDFPDGDVDGVLLGFPLFFAAAPAVGLGLVSAGAGRRWFVAERTPGPTAA